MKSQKGVTLTSLVIYITLVLTVLGILAVITANFQGNMKEIYTEGTNNAEIDKFNVYFLKEVKKQGNEINTITDNEILFITENKYTFNSNDECIYLNDNIKIAENIEKCIFSYNSSKTENEKTVVTVTIKAINAQEKQIEYVLTNGDTLENLENESNYTNYIPEDWDRTKLNVNTPIHIEIINNEINIAPIPKGYEVSTEDDENSISEGLVITDGENEFVWIPVNKDFIKMYANTDYIEPTETTLINTDTSYPYDSQETLDYYYGKDYYNFEEDFNYNIHYAEMVTSVNIYKGFYIGRYETTIDEEGKIGSKKDTTVLTTDKLLKAGINNESNENYYYRWWGIYDSQRNSDILGNGDYVQTTIVWGQQWDAMIQYFNNTTPKIDYTKETFAQLYTSGEQKSGEAKYISANTTISDKIYNIYDLRGNVLELTGEHTLSRGKVHRGGTYSLEGADGIEDADYRNYTSLPNYGDIDRY